MNPTAPGASPSTQGLEGFVADWSADRKAFHIEWGKAMMWIFLLRDRKSTRLNSSHQ